jgi:hypothetical protein
MARRWVDVTSADSPPTRFRPLAASVFDSRAIGDLHSQIADAQCGFDGPLAASVFNFRAIGDLHSQIADLRNVGSTRMRR